MRYPGGKGGAGVYQKIINLIPPHRVYVEAFAGGGNIFERKRPAASSILVERDPAVARLWRERAPAATVVEGDALQWLAARDWSGDEFVYLDPPYVLGTRTKQKIYQFEMSDADHLELVSLLAAMSDRGVRWMLSGYRNAIYDEAARAHGWRREDFQAMTRGGLRTESLWMNYEAPAAIADYSYVGSNFRERERIKRKVARWKQRLQQLDSLERAALLAAMAEIGVDPTVGNGEDRAPSILSMVDRGTV
jgi:site-specific DNA-adenine methylase